MSQRFVIALDQGTSSCRAVAVNLQGQICAQKSKLISPHREAPGLSEYQAEELLSAQLEVLHALLEQLGPQYVLALGVCSQRSSVVMWNKNTGKSLAPVLTWEDGRAQMEAQAAPISQQDIHLSTGLFKTPYFSAPKITWCLRHFPSAQKALQAGELCVAPVASYFIWKLTQGKIFATDPTLAQRTLLWNIKEGTWSDSLCKAFGVEASCLPKVLSSVSDYGTYTYKGVKIPICVCTADQQATTVYHALEPGGTSINYGTGAFVLHHTSHQLIVLPGMLSSVTVTTPDAAQQFLLEGPIFAAGSIFQWLAQTQRIVVITSQLDSLCAQAQNPVRFLPALGGLGAPYWDYKIGPVVENVTAQTTCADWAAGTLQAIAHLVADIVDYLEENGQTVSYVQAAGGLGNSSYLLQFQADLLQRPLTVYEQTEGTVLGTAFLVFRALGQEILPLCPTKRVFSPHVTPAQTKQMRSQWRSFVAACRK